MMSAKRRNSMSIWSIRLKRGVVICLTAVVLLGIMAGSAAPAIAGPSPAAYRPASVQVQVGQMTIEADGKHVAGLSQVRLEGNVRIGNQIGSTLVFELGKSSSVTVNLADARVTDIVFEQETHLLGVGVYYPILATSKVRIEPDKGLVSGAGILHMPSQSLMAQYSTLTSDFSVDVNSLIFTAHASLSDTFWGENILTGDFRLNLRDVWGDGYFELIGRIDRDLVITDRIRVGANATLRINPKEGVYEIGFDVGGLTADLPESLEGVSLSWNPLPVERLYGKLDTRARSISFSGKGGISIGGKGALRAIGLTAEANSVLTWEPWTFHGEGTLALDLIEVGKAEVLHLDVVRATYDLDFTNGRFLFTRQTQMHVGNMFGIEFDSRSFYLDIKQLVYVGTGTLYSFKGSLNPLGGTHARTSVKIDLKAGAFTGTFEEDLRLFGFTLRAQDQSFSVRPSGVYTRLSIEVLIGQEIESETIFGTDRTFGSFKQAFAIGSIKIGTGSSFTLDRLGLTITVDVFGIPVTVIVRPDGTWKIAFARLGIANGLEYLRQRHGSYQDGSWSNNVGITGLAVLAFLNFGFDETKPDVRDAIQYILDNVKNDGSVWANSDYQTYETAIALLALKATHNTEYQDEIQKARDWLVTSQWDDNCLWGSVDEDNWYWGGFGYGKSKRPDLSNTQWALLALSAAGLPKDDPTWTKATTFVLRCQNRTASNDGYQPGDDGGFVYLPGQSLAGGTKSYGSMTGAGIWSLALAGMQPTEGPFAAGLDWVNDHYTWDGNPGMSDPTSGQYYYYITMAKALTMARKTRIANRDWFDDLAKKLIDLQKRDGSWVNPNNWFWESTPELATAYSLLSLETRTLAPGEELYLAVILHSPADLHLYDEVGHHVGKNYETGGVDLQIPGSSYSEVEPQKIEVHMPEAGNYTVKLVGTAGGDYKLEVQGTQKGKVVSSDAYSGTIASGEVEGVFLNVTAMEGVMTIFASPPEALPTMEIAPRPLVLSGEQGSTITATFTMSEIGEEKEIESVTLYASDFVGSEGGLIPATSFTFDVSSFNVAAGDSQPVQVLAKLPEGIPDGEYSGTLTAESVNAGALALNTIIQVGPLKLPGDGNGDGLCTEVDALMALQMAVGKLAADLNLDVDQDGQVSERDALIILKWAVRDGQCG